MLDTLQWGIGAVMMVHQAFIAREVRWELLLTGMALMGIPGVTGLLHLVLVGKQDPTPTPDLPSPSRSV